MNIKQCVALVTGGSSGLGAACVRRFAADGAKVVIADVNTAAGEALAAEFDENVILVATDVTDEGSVREAIEAATDRYGPLTVIVNCAGVATVGKVLRKGVAHDLALFQKAVTVNLVGTFNVIRLAAEVMAGNTPNAEGERGVIINTASVAAFDGQIGQAAYSASKGGVVGMTLPIARELAELGIRVLTIAPGVFDTPMVAGLPAPAREALSSQVPFPSRFGRPEEYAALAAHIIENVMLNGEVIRLDGAIRMPPR